MGSFSISFYNFIWKSLDWIFPPVCVNCGDNGFLICPKCRQEISYIRIPHCQKCGIPGNFSGSCLSCRRAEPAFGMLRSMAIYSGPIKKAIQVNKYRREISIGNELSRYLFEFIKRIGVDFDSIVPVPLGEKRLKKRGYNQVGTFALPLSLMFEVKYSPKSMKRIRETHPQVGLSAIERQENVKNAFSANPSLVKNQNVLLLDDVATTGATLSSAANALMSAGANKVIAVTIARALSH